MPKAKTKKGAAKRLKKTSKGLIKFRKAGSGHLLGGKSRKRKRNLRKAGILNKSEIKRVSNMLG